MSATAIYTITVSNWNKHNATIKKGHKATLISNNFCWDSKIGAVPLTVRWLFLGILLTCGDLTTDTVELNERQVRDLLESSWSVDRALGALQQLQLLRYTKNEFILNRIEKKVVEEKRKEVVESSVPKVFQKDSDLNKKIWLSYANAYRLRYGIEPVRNAKVNTQVSQLRKNLGFEDAFEVVKFYLSHNDSFYLKKTHEFGLCLKDSETLRTQMKRGKAITGTMVKSFEKVQANQEYNEQISNMFKEDKNVE